MRVDRKTLTEKLWEKTDVAGFYSRYARLTKVSGKNELKGLCPLHEEKHPSFFVNLDSGSFNCFGCGTGGGPIQFYAALNDLSVFEALARLKEEFGLDGAAGLGSRSTLPSSAKVSDLSAAGVGERSLGFGGIYEALLESGRPLPEEVIQYLAGRRIRLETLEQFGVSYLEDPAKTAKDLKSRFGKEDLTQSGVFRLTKGGRLLFQFHDHPLLFPILAGGRPAFVQGRVFGDSRSRSKYCNLSGIEIPGLFNQDVLSSLSPGSPIFLCEGAPDAMILEQEGFNAVGIIGSGGFKSEWVSQLSRFKVHLVLDNDEAGRKGVEKIRKLFHDQKLPISNVILPKGIKDVNDFFLKHNSEDFVALLREVVEETVELRTTVQSCLKRVMDRSDSYSYPELAEEIFTWFENNGGAFVVNDEDRCFLMFDKVVYEIGNNLRFNALMFEKTSLSHIMFQGRMVWDMLENLSFLRGRRLGNMRWIHSDESSGIIYINLHNEDREIVRLQPGEAESMPNGTNPENVMLTDADKMKPVEFDTGVNPKDAVQLLKTLVMDVLACEQENQLFLVCWILTTFFLDFTSERALLKFSGHTSSGKTTAARILSCLIYGADWVETGTVAYYYAESSRNPYLICDNLENENLSPEVIQFLLQVATGISKGKRQAGTDTATVRESSKALVAITAIEPLTRAELINRAYDVEFKSIFQQGGFMQQEHLQKISEARSQILSGLFNLFAWEVLPGLRSQRAALLATLQQRHSRHSKHRVDSFLTLMILILKALLKMLEPGGEEKTWEVVDYWISYQNRLATVTERDTNVTFYLLEALSKEMLHAQEGFRKEYYLDFEWSTNETGEPKELSFVASSRDLLMAFQVLSRKKGFRLPFSNSQQLGVRLSNESEVLEKSGWTWQREKVVHGMRYNRFTKRLE